MNYTELKYRVVDDKEYLDGAMIVNKSRPYFNIRVIQANYNGAIGFTALFNIKTEQYHDKSGLSYSPSKDYKIRNEKLCAAWILESMKKRYNEFNNVD